MSSSCCAGPQVSVSALPQLEKLSFTLQHMVIFRMVARTGSIKDAAMALSLSAGAVSKSIAALEQVTVIMHHICPCRSRAGRQLTPSCCRCACTACTIRWTRARCGSTHSYRVQTAQELLTDTTNVPWQTFGGEGKLVQRGHGRIYRTEAGDLFLRYCESMLSVATEACKALQDYRLVSLSADDLAFSFALLSSTNAWLTPRASFAIDCCLLSHPCLTPAHPDGSCWLSTAATLSSSRADLSPWRLCCAAAPTQAL